MTEATVVGEYQLSEHGDDVGNPFSAKLFSWIQN